MAVCVFACAVSPGGPASPSHNPESDSVSVCDLERHLGQSTKHRHQQHCISTDAETVPLLLVPASDWPVIPKDPPNPQAP